MSGVVRSVMIRLGMDVSGVAAGGAKAEATLQGVSRKAQGLKRDFDFERANTMVGKTARNVALGGVAVLGVMEAANYSFDKSVSRIDAATHASAATMGQFRAAAIKAGADTSFSANEAAEGITELAKAGVSTAAILHGGLTGALSLAAAGELGVGQSAEYMATALTQFNLKGNQASHVADLLAAGAGKAQGEVSDMALALSYAGVPAAQLGVSIEQTAGTIALFAKNGIIGDRAGTGLRGMLSSLTSPSTIAAKTMKRLGIEVFDAQGKFKGIDGVAQQLHTRLSGLTQEERANALGRIFGNQQLGVANVLYKEGAKGVHEWTKQVNDSGYAQDTAKRKLNNLAGDIEYLKGDLDSLFLQRGGGAQDGLRSLVQGVDHLVTGFSNLPDHVQASVVKILALGTATSGVVYIASKLISSYRSVAGLFRTTSGIASAASGLGGVASRAGAVPVFVTNPGFAGAAGGIGSGAAAGEGAALGAAATRGGSAKLLLGKVALTAGSVFLAGQAAQGISTILKDALPKGPRETDPLFHDFTKPQKSGGFLNDQFVDLIKNRDSLKSTLTTVSQSKGGGGLDGFGLRSNINLGKLATLGTWNAISDDEERVRKLDDALAALDKRSPGEALAAYSRILDETGLSAAKVNEILPKTAAALDPHPGSSKWWDDMAHGLQNAARQGLQTNKVLKTIPKDIRTFVSTPGLITSLSHVRDLQHEYHLTPKQVRTIMRVQGFSETQTRIVLAGKAFQRLPRQVRSRLIADTVKSQADVKKLQARYNLTPRQVRTVMQVSGVDAAIAKAHALRAAIAAVQSKSVTIDLITRRRTIGGGQFAATAKADGGRLPRGGPYRDDFLTPTAPGEYIVSNRYGQVDRNIGTLERINSRGYADGGQIGRVYQRAGHGPAGGDLAAALRGMKIVGTLDTPFGPAEMRGLVLDVMAEGDDMAGMRSRAAR